MFVPYVSRDIQRIIRNYSRKFGKCQFDDNVEK